jgi:hypothetical protein
MPGDDITEHGRDEKVDIVLAIVLEDVSAARRSSSYRVNKRKSHLSYESQC